MLHKLQGLDRIVKLYDYENVVDEAEELLYGMEVWVGGKEEGQAREEARPGRGPGQARQTIVRIWSFLKGHFFYKMSLWRHRLDKKPTKKKFQDFFPSL